MSKKRVLWIFNHTSLRRFEVPMLIDMGYEVYCPKIWNILDFSASVTYEYDKSLSIPKDVLEKLNRTDFYTELSEEIMELINSYFDIAICMLQKDLLESLAKKFKGAIGLHVFGLASSVDYTTILGNSLLSMLMACGSRFWFLPTYDNLSSIECPMLQKRTLYLPIGLANTEIKNTWVGGDKRFLFISPKIKTNTYYAEVYKDFCQNFGDLPHVIGGAQPQPVPEDNTVTGFLSSEAYEYNMNHLSCMYYHSQEKYHLHYHPLEAIKQGMPLIFMAGGMLDHLGGRSLPGRAQNVRDAKKKIKRLIDGDKSFIKQIVDSQSILLEPFNISRCKPVWECCLKKIESSLHSIDTELERKKRKRLAIVMPAAYTGGVLDYSIRFVKNLNSQIIKKGDLVDLVFAYPNNKVFENNNYFKDLEDNNIEIRRIDIITKDANWVSRAIRLNGFESDKGIKLDHVEYSVLHDGIADFQDCDYIIFTADSDTNGHPFFCLRPFSLVVHDYIQRYVPEAITSVMSKTKYDNQQSADKIIVTSEATYRDALQYGRHPYNKVFLTPLLLEMADLCPYTEEQPSDKEMEYFIWSTNATPHKNHIKALHALELYYQNGGKLKCYITGANTQYLSPKSDLEDAPVSKEYVNSIQNIIKKSESLTKNLIFKGDMVKFKFYKALKHAKFIFHPGYGDNGNGTVVDAAGLGIPSLSSDYPAMRYLAKFMGINICFVSPFCVDCMADALLDMECNCNYYSSQLPDRSILIQSEYYNQAEQLYKCIKSIVGF